MDTPRPHANLVTGIVKKPACVLGFEDVLKLDPAALIRKLRSLSQSDRPVEFNLHGRALGKLSRRLDGDPLSREFLDRAGRNRVSIQSLQGCTHGV